MTKTKVDMTGAPARPNKGDPDYAEKVKARRAEYSRRYRQLPEVAAAEKRRGVSRRLWSDEHRAARKERASRKAKEAQRAWAATARGRAMTSSRKARYLATESGLQMSRTYARAYVAKKRQEPGNQEMLRDRTFEHHHGVTRQEADQMIEAQGGLCAICNQPATGKGHCSRLFVDHCHETGEMRGMLCHQCNAGLGMFKDDLKKMEAAVAYLKRHYS